LYSRFINQVNDALLFPTQADEQCEPFASYHLKFPLSSVEIIFSSPCGKRKSRCRNRDFPKRINFSRKTENDVVAETAAPLSDKLWNGFVHKFELPQNNALISLFGAFNYRRDSFAEALPRLFAGRQYVPIKTAGDERSNRL
jgi:hypothetical protein